MESPDGEPEFGPWHVCSVADVLELLGQPRVLAIDGRSGSGKSTLTARIVEAVPGAAVVHTDDIAWYHDFFDWSELMACGVLRPLRDGGAVHFRPPEWDARGRDGAITVAACCPLVIVEGVGIGRRWERADLVLSGAATGPDLVIAEQPFPRVDRSGTVS